MEPDSRVVLSVNKYYVQDSLVRESVRHSMRRHGKTVGPGGAGVATGSRDVEAKVFILCFQVIAVCCGFGDKENPYKTITDYKGIPRRGRGGTAYSTYWYAGI